MWDRVWDDWFMLKSAWLPFAVPAGIMVGAFLAERRHARRHKKAVNHPYRVGSKNG